MCMNPHTFQVDPLMFPRDRLKAGQQRLKIKVKFGPLRTEAKKDLALESTGLIVRSNQTKQNHQSPRDCKTTQEFM